MVIEKNYLKAFYGIKSITKRMQFIFVVHFQPFVHEMHSFLKLRLFYGYRKNHSSNILWVAKYYKSNEIYACCSLSK